jgi:hypothetical protein
MQKIVEKVFTGGHDVEKGRPRMIEADAGIVRVLRAEWQPI